MHDEEHIFHNYDHDIVFKKLNGFYGQVAKNQNDDIIKLIKGEGEVLDVGAGYGTLTKQLIENGFDVTAIDPYIAKIQLAKKWYDLDIEPIDIYNTPFEDNRFNCVIMREVVYHLEMERVIAELNRICKHQIIIFQGNNVILRKVGQLLWGHKEFNERKRDYYIEFLENNNYKINSVSFRDLIAFPISGGLIGRQLLPNISIIVKFLIYLDNIINSILSFFKIQKYFCLRFIINAEKNIPL